MSMDSSEFRRTALLGCLLKGVTLRRDVREFLMNGSERLRRVHEAREHGLERLNRYPGKPENLAGLSAEKDLIRFPPGTTEEQKDSIRANVTPLVAPDEGRTTRYRKLWLGRILDLYGNSPAHIVFLQVPRSPLPVHEGKVAARFLQSVASRPNVAILRAEAFQDFETPEVFADGAHLNREGRRLFSDRLAENVESILGIH
jgi:hypothetical protein